MQAMLYPSIHKCIPMYAFITNKFNNIYYVHKYINYACNIHEQDVKVKHWSTI